MDNFIDENIEHTCKACLRILFWNWAHGLPTKALTMSENVNLIRSDLQKTPPDIEGIEAKLSVIDNVIKGITNYPSPFQLQKVFVNALLEKRVNILKQDRKMMRISFRVNLSPIETVVYANSIWLRHLIDIVIENALEALRKSSTKQVVITSIVSTKTVTITISDSGPGIDPNYLPILFTKPHLQNPTGRGRGGYIAKMLAELYGGEIKIDKTNNAGTTVAIKLPIITSK